MELKTTTAPNNTNLLCVLIGMFVFLGFVLSFPASTYFFQTDVGTYEDYGMS